MTLEMRHYDTLWKVKIIYNFYMLCKSYTTT